MPIFDEDDAQRSAFGSVTGALGSNQAIDLDNDARDRDFLGEKAAEIFDIAKALLQTHPDYDNEVDKWRKYLDLYQANDIYRFIHRHLRESDSAWKKRVERGYYYNYVAAVVDLFTAFLFHAPVDRDLGDDIEFFEEIHKDADLQKTLYSVFMRNACIFAQVEGHIGILVDMPNISADQIPQNEAQRKELGFHPYLVLLHADQIMDWELDQFGNFNWVKLKIQRPLDRTWQQSAVSDTQHFVIWTRESFEEWEVVGEGPGAEARMINSGDNPAGRVPLVILRMQKKPDHPWFGMSAVRDIADINIGILNWSSLGDEEIFERCLNVLALERADSDAKVELSHANVLEFEPGAAPPRYLEPGPTALNNIRTWIEDARAEIRRLAKLNISSGLMDVRQSSSGIAQAFQFLETNQTLADKALSLEQAETEIHKLLAAWGNIEFTGSISYSRDFGVEDFLLLFQELGLAKNSLTSETAIKELEKKIIRKIFAKSSMELRAKIEKEIDAVQPQSIVSPFGMLPPGPVGGSDPDIEGSQPSESAEDAGNGTATNNAGEGTQP